MEGEDLTPTACHLGSTLLLMSRPSSVFPVAPVTVDPRLLHLEIRLRLAKVRSDDPALIHQLKADIRRIEHLGDRQRGGAPKKLKTPCLLENRPSKPTPHGHVHNKVKVVKEQPEGEEAQGRMNELTSFCSKNVCSLRDDGTAGLVRHDLDQRQDLCFGEDRAHRPRPYVFHPRDRPHPGVLPGRSLVHRRLAGPPVLVCQGAQGNQRGELPA